MSGSGSLSVPEGGIPASLLRGSPFEGEYTAVSFLGRGSFGQVFKLVRPFDGKHYALKVFDKSLENSKKYEGFFRREAEVLKAARCRNVVQFHEYYENQSYMFILLEFCEGGDLNQFLRQGGVKKGRKMAEDEIVAVVKGVLNSLYYLHYSENIIHRDLKPGRRCSRANILVRNDGSRPLVDDDVCLADFGLCVVLNSYFNLKARMKCGTDSYMSPEQICGEAYDSVSPADQSTDMFSLAITTFVLATGEHPFITQDGKLDLEKQKRADWRHLESRSDLSK
jgi:serine/threonine protein kinase